MTHLLPLSIPAIRTSLGSLEYCGSGLSLETLLSCKIDAVNTKFADIWPNLTRKGEQLPDAEAWDGKPDKEAMLSENPGAGD